ncbi:DUF503 domain-containing protein [bacterium]|nr:DUF503 domain-containing protein [bacterium]
MLVGTLQVELHISGAQSLKEKRFILKSIITRLRNNFNISVSEVDYQDKWQRACIGIASVSNSRRFIDSVFTRVMNAIIKDNRVELIDNIIEIL